jgi:hypothetical protein
VIAERFVGVARAVVPFVAGTSGLSSQGFVAFSLTGALAWSALLTLLGYAFSGSIGAAGDAVTRIAFGAVLVAGALIVLRRRVRSGGAVATRPRMTSHPRSPRSIMNQGRRSSATRCGTGRDRSHDKTARTSMRQAPVQARSCAPARTPDRASMQTTSSW